jgi:hypothetical protein
MTASQLPGKASRISQPLNGGLNTWAGFCYQRAREDSLSVFGLTNPVYGILIAAMGIAISP